ncbi:MAG: 50S ribosomal protein L16 [Planctomycetes bacterium]|nr:50S ribosomal protein L16 [Planctomycetota bacterium]
MPKRVVYRKMQRGKMRGNATRGNRIAFGDFGLQSLEMAWLSGREIEAGRIAASRAAGEAKVWIRVFPHKPITKKPLETRMGHGKGEPEFWAAVVKPGTILFEMGGVTEDVARTAFNRVAHKLSVRTRFIRRHVIGQ